MFTLGHISDIHLSPLPRPALYHLFSKRFLGFVNWQRRKGRHRRDVLDRVTGDLLERQPDHLAVTGDLVNIALPEEFRLARQWLDSLGRPVNEVTVIPGNHDAYSPFMRDPRLRYWKPYMMPNDGAAPFANAPGLHFPFVRIVDRIAIIGLSSGRPTFPGMASGWLGPKQIRQTASLLDRFGKEGYCRVVLIHHPPLPGMTGHLRALHDARAFRRILIDHGAELVLHGHNHRTMERSLETKTGALPIIGVSSASLITDKPHTCASYNLFTICGGGGQRWRIERHRRTLDPSGEFLDAREELVL